MMYLEAFEKEADSMQPVMFFGMSPVQAEKAGTPFEVLDNGETFGFSEVLREVEDGGQAGLEQEAARDGLIAQATMLDLLLAPAPMQPVLTTVGGSVDTETRPAMVDLDQVRANVSALAEAFVPGRADSEPTFVLDGESFEAGDLVVKETSARFLVAFDGEAEELPAALANELRAALEDKAKILGGKAAAESGPLTRGVREDVVISQPASEEAVDGLVKGGQRTVVNPTAMSADVGERGGADIFGQRPHIEKKSLEIRFDERVIRAARESGPSISHFVKGPEVMPVALDHVRKEVLDEISSLSVSALVDEDEAAVRTGGENGIKASDVLLGRGRNGVGFDRATFQPAAMKAVSGGVVDQDVRVQTEKGRVVSASTSFSSVDGEDAGTAGLFASQGARGVQDVEPGSFTVTSSGFESEEEVGTELSFENESASLDRAGKTGLEAGQAVMTQDGVGRVRGAELDGEQVKVQVREVSEVAKHVQDLIAAKRPGRIEVVLTPEDLGTVSVAIQRAGSAMSVEVKASDERVHQTLQTYRQEMLQTLESKGVSVTNLHLSRDAGLSNQGGGQGFEQTFAREDFERAVNLRGEDALREAAVRDARPSYRPMTTVDYTA